MGWIGVDLDGTLAKYGGWKDGAVGEPIVPMLNRVKEWLAEGQEVRIVTARVSGANIPSREVHNQYKLIDSWCLEHLGQTLKVTCEKDYNMEVLFDDRCIHVEANTGRIIG